MFTKIKTKIIAVDTETTGLNWHKDTIEVVSFSDGKTAEAIRWSKLDMGRLKVLLGDSSIAKLVFSKFDIKMFHRMGIAHINNYIDVYNMAKLYNENLKEYKLKSLAKQYLGDTSGDQQNLLWKYIDEKLGGVFDSSKIPDNILLPYASKDALLTYQLYAYFKPEIDKNFQKVFELENKVSPIVNAMEERGMRIDVPFLRRQYNKFEVRIDTLRKELERILHVKNINFGSGKQLAEVFTRNNIPFSLTEKGNPEFNKDSLGELKHPVAKKLLEYKQCIHVQKTYCKGLPDEAVGDIVHPNLNQYKAVTSRFSCSSPNLQNIPNEAGNIRKAFICREGYYNFYFDYKQIEMIILADYCKDETMLKSIQDNVDLHTTTASRLFHVPIAKVTNAMRKKAKTFNFAVIYGESAKGLSKDFEISYDEAQKQLNEYLSLYPAIRLLRHAVEQKIAREGHVKTAYGHWRRLSKSEAYMGVNAIIQGSAADLIKLAMVKVAEILKGRRSNLLLQIHDELVIEISGCELYLVPKIKAAMEDFKDLFEIPIKVDVEYTKTNWENTKPYKV